jgi:hypothetical protein
MRGSVHKKTRPDAAGEISFARTVSILFQNGFFGKDGRLFGHGRWLDIPRYGAYSSTFRWIRNKLGLPKEDHAERRLELHRIRAIIE